MAYFVFKVWQVWTATTPEWNEPGYKVGGAEVRPEWNEPGYKVGGAEVRQSLRTVSGPPGLGLGAGGQSLAPVR